MKTWKILACAAVLALAGCSNAPTQKQADEQVAEEGANTVQNGKDAATEEKDTTSDQSTPVSSSDKIKSQADKIQQGLKDAGFTITDLEQKIEEISFDANNKNSSLGVDVEYEKNAKGEYDRLVADDELERQDEYAKDKLTLSVLKNWEDGTYEIVALDEENSLVYEIDDIQEADLDAVKSVMAQAGFQVE